MKLSAVLGLSVLVFVANCDAPSEPRLSGRIEIIAIAQNVDQDPDGFTVYIDDDSVGTVRTNGAQEFTISAGTHHVRLGDVAHNCTPQQLQSETTILPDTTNRLTFEVTCRRTLGNKLLFFSHREGEWKIIAMRYDGSNSHEVDFGLPFSVVFASVSPDGQSVLFTSRGFLFSGKIDGSIPTAWPIRGYNARWSPDASRIVYLMNDNVYVADSTGTEVTQLTNTHYWKAYPAWSPDGSVIAFASYIGIVTIDDNGVGKTVVANDFYGPNMPAWSPDGWVSFAGMSGNDTSWKIYSKNAGTGEIRKESKSNAEEILPAWSPDGEWLAFLSDRNPVWNVYLQSRDGSVRVRLTDGRFENTFPFFGPRLPE